MHHTWVWSKALDKESVNSLERFWECGNALLIKSSKVRLFLDCSFFKIVVIFNNTSADFVLISADVLLKMIIILKELRILQLCSYIKWTDFRKHMIMFEVWAHFSVCSGIQTTHWNGYTTVCLLFFPTPKPFRPGWIPKSMDLMLWRCYDQLIWTR